MAPPLRLTLQNTLVLPLAICLPLRKTGEEWGSSLGLPWREGPTKRFYRAKTGNRLLLTRLIQKHTRTSHPEVKSSTLNEMFPSKSQSDLAPGGRGDDF